jgi:hypothetical protein
VNWCLRSGLDRQCRTADPSSSTITMALPASSFALGNHSKETRIHGGGRLISQPRDDDDLRGNPGVGKPNETFINSPSCLATGCSPGPLLSCEPPAPWFTQIPLRSLPKLLEHRGYLPDREIPTHQIAVERRDIIR